MSGNGGPRDKRVIVKNTFLQEVGSPEVPQLTRGISAPTSSVPYYAKREIGIVDTVLEEQLQEGIDTPSSTNGLQTPQPTELMRLQTGDPLPPMVEPSQMRTGDTSSSLRDGPPTSGSGNTSIRQLSGQRTLNTTDGSESPDMPARELCRLLTGDFLSPRELCRIQTGDVFGDAPLAYNADNADNASNDKEQDFDEMTPPMSELTRLVTGDYWENGDDWNWPQQAISAQLQSQLAAPGMMVGVQAVRPPVMMPSYVLVGASGQPIAPQVPLRGVPWPPQMPVFVDPQMTVQAPLIESQPATASTAQVDPGPAMPQGLHWSVNETTGAHRVTWSVDARKLKSTDRQIVSPSFYMHGIATPFKLLLFPVISSEARGGSSFKNAGGKGIVQLKCEGAPSGEDGRNRSSLILRFFVGSQEEPRGPVTNDFQERPVCGLPQNIAQWDLAAAVEQGKIALGVEAMIHAP
eukprot:GEMP01017895.1.p1 GENE.GEMP01017895.1~~GEMP01017895.1.p1  ORF type:complete len:515 (+),score=97.99 GEMP01017895.1:158-1546(+)